MKTRRFIPLVLAPLLFACVPAKPAVPLTEVPAGPLLQALDQRRQSFQSLKAIAAVQVSRKGRKTAFDSVGILLKSQEKLKLEAYGPLGQPLIELAWSGGDVLVRQHGEIIRRKPGAGLERLFGAEVEPREFCAAIAGNIPEPAAGTSARASCGGDGCVLELRQGELMRRIRLAPDAAGAVALPVSSELYRADALVYRARFERTEPFPDAPVPRTVIIENPERKTGLTIRYEDIEVNVPVDDGAFELFGAEGTGR